MEDLSGKRLFLLDMDGTIYLGDRLFDGCLDFLRHVREVGGRYIFMTNNSSKSVQDYVKKLNRLGIAAELDDFLSSSQATAAYLTANHADDTIYVLGTRSLKEELHSHGLRVVDTLQDGISCLTVGFDTELTFAKLEDACRLLLHDIAYIATNPDWVCPTEFGYVPDCGSVCEMLWRSSGKRPHVIGKPQPDMPLMAVAGSGFSKEETLIVGDRLYTDIACGKNAGIDTLLVLSGESTVEDIEKSEVKPDYILKDIQALNTILKEGK